MAELLVDVPQMQRDLQRAREDNAYLRTLLQQLNAESVDAAVGLPPPSGKAQKPRNASTKGKPRAKDVDEIHEEQTRFDRALARREARVDSASEVSGSLAAGLELKSANDRITQLERQLLHAEETICHLKAEKLEALRDVERLSVAVHDGSRRGAGNIWEKEQQDVGAMRTLILELETRLSEQQQAHALEQEQRMAVIREQESELNTLRAELKERSQQLQELQQRHMDLLELDKPVITKHRSAGDLNQLSIIGEESDEEVTDKKPKKGTGRRARASANAALPKWQEELVRHPTPHFDLDSPEVTYLLHAWTANVKKMQYLRRWFTQVVVTRGPLPADFPLGVELPRLPPEVRDGFLTLVVPLLRRQTEREILAHSRRYNDGFHTDLRLRVVPRE
ncbi:hypothetical protein BBJ28_00000500 [Nothophytophthora sp. Chile5]|nr:hypothetical protein BBJ28_00000500 [Nothophytophthora sp. Chile5]